MLSLTKRLTTSNETPFEDKVELDLCVGASLCVCMRVYMLSIHKMHINRKHISKKLHLQQIFTNLCLLFSSKILVFISYSILEPYSHTPTHQHTDRTAITRFISCCRVVLFHNFDHLHCAIYIANSRLFIAL